MSWEEFTDRFPWVIDLMGFTVICIMLFGAAFADWIAA